MSLKVFLLDGKVSVQVKKSISIITPSVWRIELEKNITAEKERRDNIDLTLLLAVALVGTVASLVIISTSLPYTDLLPSLSLPVM